MSAKINLLISFYWKVVIRWKSLIDSEDIDKEYHNKIFDNNVFENLYTKVDLNKYSSLKNKIYWISLLIYRISMVNYLNSLNKGMDVKNH